MELHIGDKASLSRTITQNDVQIFAELTGDVNKIHLSDSAAENAGFKKTIIHGMFMGGLISAVIGTLLPGEGAVYLEQNLQFKKPAYCDDTCRACVCVEEIINVNKGIYKLETLIENQKDEILVKGYAVVKYKDF